MPNKPGPLYLDKKYWSANQGVEPGSHQDIWQFNPWRAPGKAPVWDACGMAGGSPVETYGAAAYNATVNAKQGDLGSEVLKPRPSGTVWRRGGIGVTRWQMTARHGGGYQFRCRRGRAPVHEPVHLHVPVPVPVPAPVPAPVFATVPPVVPVPVPASAHSSR